MCSVVHTCLPIFPGVPLFFFFWFLAANATSCARFFTSWAVCELVKGLFERRNGDTLRRAASLDGECWMGLFQVGFGVETSIIGQRAGFF